MKCDICDWDYPSDYLAPFDASTLSVPRCCGICALVLSNQVHGTTRKKFDGSMAEDMRQRAIEWRKSDHPRVRNGEGVADH